MDFYIDNRQTDIAIDEDEVYDLFEKVLRECLIVEGIGTDYEIAISLVNNEEIKNLNRDYRGVDSETDVLSFPMDDEFHIGLPLLGDIIISVEKALEQSQEYGHSLERELAYLACHSMFHLMGYDHMELDEKQEMRNKEKEVMKNLGIFKADKGE
ncbi:MAG: rRNA maturation RNase YbeY [Tissierellaceae bacterium]|nr:rRNA maturation RNase YbeY [Tissierellaceae bacterium]